MYHGIDAIHVSRIRTAIENHGERFLTRVFTLAERQYAQSRYRKDEHFAARFAAKEAVLKALGTGWGAGIGWTDVEIVHEATGEPTVRLYNEAAKRSAARKINRWVLSLTHTNEIAFASVIGLSTAV